MQPITPFDDAPKPPYAPGEVPRAGWCNIDVCGRWPFEPKDILALKQLHGLPGADDDPADVRDQWHEVLTPEAMDAMIEAFDREGRQIAVTADHSFFSPRASSEAYGWIGALHRDGERLWAWIEWTDDGYPKVNGKSYIDFSTEHQYRHYRDLGDGDWAAQRLDGLSLTNFANHQGKIVITNTTQPNPTRKETMKTKTKTNDCAPADDKAPQKVNNDGAPPEEVDTRPADPQPAVPDPEDTQTNDARAYDALEDIADILGLEDTATIDSIKERIRYYIDRIRELEKGLAAANETATNSRRYPNLFGGPRSARTNTRPLRGGKPNDEKVMRIGGREVRVNSQDIALARHCQDAVEKEEAKLGRHLSAAEYSDVYGRACDQYRNQN